MNQLELLCVIPARGNSKGILKKNLKLLNSKPLLTYAIESAKQSKYITRIVVSTENEDIADLSRKQGAEVPFMRPENLAEDDVHSVDVVLDVLAQLESNEDYSPDLVMMRLPTTPFVSSEQIDDAVRKFAAGEQKSLISVCEYDKHFSSLRMINDGLLSPVMDTNIFNVQRQSYKTYVVNAAIYIAYVDALREARSFHRKVTDTYVMDKVSSIDINDEFDFEICEYFMNKHQDNVN